MNPDHLTTSSKKVHLLSSEKDAMRASILRAASERIPARPTPSPFFSYTFLTRLSSATLILLVMTGSGIAYAAQISRPGDALYAFELSVIEPIEEYFQDTPEKQIAYHTDRLEERLAELKDASKDETNPTDYVSFNDKAIEHAVAIETALVEEDEAEKKVDVLIEVSALMQANEEILEDINAETNMFDDSEKHIRESLSDAFEEYISSEEDTVKDILLEDLEDTNIASSTDESQTEELQARLDSIEEDIQRGDFEEAFRRSIDVRVETLKQNLLLNDEYQPQEETTN